MTKSEFIEKVKTVGGYETKKEAEKAVEAFTAAIKETLVEGDTVSLIGFGTYSTTKVAEKSGKVPGTDKTYVKPAHIAPKFKFGKPMKDALN